MDDHRPGVPIQRPRHRGAETRVLRLLCAGHPVRHIAEQLGIAPSTAKSHILRIYEKNRPAPPGGSGGAGPLCACHFPLARNTRPAAAFSC
ncbi:helix-turn-helix domain-containing protein [Devosia sp.]|uniref:helix-turn-helix domain-containing protein n=1 Tax=Devosia sp. TaxID=1871048 RepID=UPI003A598E1D